LKLFFKYLPCIFLLLFANCDNEEMPLEPETSQAYFPLSVGLYHIYDVDQITYSLSDDPDTVVYELKSIVADSFPNTGDGITYVVHRFTRSNGEELWEPIDTWSIRKDEDKVVVSEGNIPFMKLRWPSNVGDTWDGNAFNNLGEDEYVLDFEDGFAVNDAIFNDVAVIEQELNEDPIVFTDIRYEMYAAEAGLIYKETKQLHYCVEQSCNNQNIIIDGIVLKQRLKSYGLE